MTSPWPRLVDVPVEAFLGDAGWRVVRRFGQRLDSRSVIIGVERGGERRVVKYATDAEAVSWLESAWRFHSAVRHPAIAAAVARIEVPGGVALVEDWARGEILTDAFDELVPPREHPESAYRRFLRLSVEDIAAAVMELVDAHVAVAAAGFVAVDLYDGCVLYDFAARRVSLVDLDHYQPGPYVLSADRQLGSTTFMAPEEFTRGATIDERTTVYTLGRMAQVYLGCKRRGPATRSDFRGSDQQFAVAATATEARPGSRFPTVRDLRDAWATAR